MKTIISLRGFATTGAFGPVSLGTQKNVVVDLIGEPHNDVEYFRGSRSLNYAWYEIFYDAFTGEVVGIQNDHLFVLGRNHKADIFFKTDKAEIDKWFLKFTRNVTWDQVIIHLNKEEIPHSIEKHFEDDIILFDSGVTPDFVDDPKTGELVLNGIRLFQL